MYNTYSNIKTKEFTIKDLKKCADTIIKKKESEIKKLKWFTKLMNKFGWHRKYEVLIFDKEKFNWFNKENIMKVNLK